MSIGGSLLLE